MNIYKKLHDWYEVNQRQLPWKQDRDPYKIWVSEVILQQTRVEQGKGYYYRFLERFPTVDALASAAEADVLLVWQGLGYYSRARNMHTAAKQVMRQFNGVFPNQYSELITLKGVGDYTASAIASFSSKAPLVAVDGNVIRVVSRLFCIEEDIGKATTHQLIKKLGLEMLGDGDSAFFNQALMDFGSLQCVPKSPDCGTCVLQEECVAFRDHLVDVIPKKEKRVKVRNRYLYFLIIKEQGAQGGITLLQQQKGKGIWQNMYLFPFVEQQHLRSWDEVLQEHEFQNFFKKTTLNIEQQSHQPIIHILSHQRLHAHYAVFTVEDISLINDVADAESVLLLDFEHYPQPKLMEIILGKVF